VSEFTCKELVELVTDYFDDALPPGDQRRFEQHISQCPGCTEHLEHLRVTIRAVGALREEAVPAPAREELLATFREWKRRGG
jgi:anti-sigma factor RsiW